MNFLYSLLAEVTVTPIPVPDDLYNSPGTIGFIVTFLIAAAAVFLIFDMNRRVRKTRYRTEIRAKLALEELENLMVEKPKRPAPPIRPNRGIPEADSDR